MGQQYSDNFNTDVPPDLHYYVDDGAKEELLGSYRWLARYVQELLENGQVRHQDLESVRRQLNLCRVTEQINCIPVPVIVEAITLCLGYYPDIQDGQTFWFKSGDLETPDKPCAEDFDSATDPDHPNLPPNLKPSKEQTMSSRVLKIPALFVVNPDELMTLEEVEAQGLDPYADVAEELEPLTDSE